MPVDRALKTAARHSTCASCLIEKKLSSFYMHIHIYINTVYVGAKCRFFLQRSIHTALIFAVRCYQFTRRSLLRLLGLPVTLRKPKDKIRADDELFSDKRRMPHYERLDS